MHCQEKNTRKGVLHGRDKTLCKCDTSETFLKIGVYVSICLSCLLISIIPRTCLRLLPACDNHPLPEKLFCSPGHRFFPALSLYLGGKTNSSSSQQAFKRNVISSTVRKTHQKKKRQHLKHWNLEKKNTITFTTFASLIVRCIPLNWDKHKASMIAAIIWSSSIDLGIYAMDFEGAMISSESNV